LDFGETFVPVKRLEVIRILLTYASHHEMKLYQMDVKSAFLNGFINKLVYVDQPSRFEDPRYPNHVYRLSNALYRLKQAQELGMSAFRISSLRRASPLGRSTPHYSPRSLIEISSFVKYILLISYLAQQMKNIAKSLVSKEFKMSMIGELTFFLGFQVKQMREGIFISQEKYTKMNVSQSRRLCHQMDIST
jgi:hypothetical protein